MSDGYITISTYVTLDVDWFERIHQCALDLSLSDDEVLRAVINTSVRRHFEFTDLEDSANE